MEVDHFQAIYDGQFNRYLLLSQAFLKRMRGYHDRKICLHWIQRNASLTTSSAALTKDRNLFFQYFIKVMLQAILEETLKEFPSQTLQDFKLKRIQVLDIIEDPNWLKNELNIPAIVQKSTKSHAPYFAHWSKDQKTYLAAKALPGRGALVYLAVCTDPSLGWTNLTE